VIKHDRKGKDKVRSRLVRRKLFGVITAVGLVVALLLTACAPGPTVEGKKVEVASVVPVTGAAAASVQLMLLGIQDYFRYFNEQEGIPGVRVKHTFGDTVLQYALLRSHYERFVERGVPVMHIEEATGLLALKSRFERDQVVVIGMGFGYEKVAYPPGWCYSSSPTIAEQFAVVLEYFMENWQEERPPRLAFMSIDSPIGYEPLGEGTRYAQKLGFEVLPPEFVPFVVLDATSQLLRLKERGADLVYITGLPAASGPILRDVERLGLSDEMQFACHYGAFTERVIEMARVGAEGLLVARMFPWFDETEVPGIKLMLDTQMEYRGKVIREAEYMHGWMIAPATCEAIRRAIENVGYENLDGRAIKEAFDSIKDFDVDGLATIIYKPGDHRGATKVAIYEVRDGKIIRVSDWREAPTLVPEES
jgi:branched-chain amino acid transport system substrate-binding protein